MPRLTRSDVVRRFARAVTPRDDVVLNRRGAYVGSGSTSLDRTYVSGVETLDLTYNGFAVARMMKMTVQGTEITVYWVTDDDSIGRGMYGLRGISSDVYQALQYRATYVVPTDGEPREGITRYYYRAPAPFDTWAKIVAHGKAEGEKDTKEQAKSDERDEKRVAAEEVRKAKARRIVESGAAAFGPESALAKVLAEKTRYNTSVETIARFMLDWMSKQPGSVPFGYSWKRVEKIAIAQLRTIRGGALRAGEAAKISDVVKWLANPPSKEKVAARKLLQGRFVSRYYDTPSKIAAEIMAHDWEWDSIFLPGVQYDFDKLEREAQALLPELWASVRAQAWDEAAENKQRSRLTALIDSLKLAKDPAAVEKVIEAFFDEKEIAGGGVRAYPTLLTESDTLWSFAEVRAMGFAARWVRYRWNKRRAIFVVKGTDYTERLVAEAKKRKLVVLTDEYNDYPKTEDDAAYLYARDVLGVEVPRRRLYDTNTTRLLELWDSPTERFYPDEKVEPEAPRKRLLDMTAEPIITSPRAPPIVERRLLDMTAEPKPKGFFSQGVPKIHVPTVDEIPPSRAEIVPAAQAAFSWQAGRANALANDYQFFAGQGVAEALTYAVAADGLANEWPSWFVEIFRGGLQAANNQATVQLFDNPQGAGDRWNPRNKTRDRLLHFVIIRADDDNAERIGRARVVHEGPARRTIEDRAQAVFKKVMGHRKLAVEARLVEGKGDVPSPGDPRLIDMEDMQLPADFEERVKKLQTEGKRLLEMSKTASRVQEQVRSDTPLAERIKGAIVCWKRRGVSVASMQLVDGDVDLSGMDPKAAIVHAQQHGVMRDVPDGQGDICGTVTHAWRVGGDDEPLALLVEFERRVYGRSDRPPYRYGLAYWQRGSTASNPVVTSYPQGGINLIFMWSAGSHGDVPPPGGGRAIELDGLFFAGQRRRR